MKIKPTLCIVNIALLIFSVSAVAFSGRGLINDDIQYYGVEISGENSLYVAGELNYYVEEDKRIVATLLFYDIFDKLLAKANIKATLTENTDSVLFDVPIYIDDASDPLEVKSAHHIRWEVSRIERVECCANNGGIAGCDEETGKIRCYDDEIIPTCTCEEYNISE